MGKLKKTKVLIISKILTKQGGCVLYTPTSLTADSRQTAGLILGSLPSIQT